MTISELFSSTAGDAGFIWSAVTALAQLVEALVVLFSAIAVVFQLRHLRQETIENRISGLKLAVDYLSSDSFTKVTSAAMKDTIIHGINWRSLLDQVNIVALMVEQGYTDRELLFQLKGNALAAIGRYLQSHNIASDLSQELKTAYRLGELLMRQAVDWHSKQPGAGEPSS